MLTAIVGINWGDEGKGRMVDLISQDYDIVCRYQGGNNAGHTVINHLGKFILNLIPSGILISGVEKFEIPIGTILISVSISNSIGSLFLKTFIVSFVAEVVYILLSNASENSFQELTEYVLFPSLTEIIWSLAIRTLSAGYPLDISPMTFDL